MGVGVLVGVPQALPGYTDYELRSSAPCAPRPSSSKNEVCRNAAGLQERPRRSGERSTSPALVRPAVEVDHKGPAGPLMLARTRHPRW